MAQRQTAYCLLLRTAPATAHCVVPTAYCPRHCPLRTAYCVLPYCPLPTA